MKTIYKCLLGILLSGLSIGNSYSQVQSPNVDSVYNLINGDWIQFKRCSGMTGKCDTVYSTQVHNIDRIAGTDSITWKTYSNDTLLSTSKYLLTYSKSLLSKKNNWMLTQTYSSNILFHESISIKLETRILIDVSTEGLSVAPDVYDGGGSLYTRLKSVTGIAIQTDNSKLSISPNPTVNSFTINGIDNIESIKILDLNGNVLQNKAHEKLDVINISEFPSGIYIIQAVSKDKVYTEKLIKE